MMTEPYLTTVLEEAEHVAEHHDQVARTIDNQAHEYLRYAVLRVLEGEAEHPSVDWTPIDGVTVDYGSDEPIFDSWGSSEEWWETIPPKESCTRFRVFFTDDHQTVPRDIVDVMAALAAWCVWTGSAAACGSYDHHERSEVNYLWPEGHPVEEVFHERLSGLRKPSLRTVAERATFATGWSSTRTHSRQTISSPRTKRAVAEAMDVSLLSKGGRYEVQSASGSRYEVDVIDESCTCPDWQQRSPEGDCKHLRCVDHEIKRGRVPRPDGRLPTTPE